MGITKRALKAHHSRRADEARHSKFTNVVNRQKGLCWFCGTNMGADCTREHLFSQTLGGTNTYPPGNLKAAHADCNSHAGHLPVRAKYKLRDIAHAQGRNAMFATARRMRRAQARAGFAKMTD